MALIRLAPELADDLSRIADHLLAHDASGVEDRLRGMVEAIDVLRSNPLIGRPQGEAMRELVMGRDARGYVALYRYVAVVDTVFVLAIRAQREAGYARSE